MKAIGIGSIGALAETSEIQRACFNQALAEHKTGLHWNIATYCDAIQKPGGFARLTALGLGDETARAIHHRKQELFAEAIKGVITPRTGIVDLMSECAAQNITMAFVTTTTKQTLDAVIDALGDQIDFDQFKLITHAEHAARPKPYSDIYHFALETLGCIPAEMLAIEDTEANVKSAQNAGITTLFTPGEYALVSSMSASSHQLSYAQCEAHFAAAA